MPFTPFHLGPGLLLGVLLYRHLDLGTVLAASMAVDLRTVLVFSGVLDGPLHGALHTFALAPATGIAAGAALYIARERLRPVYEAFRLDASDSWNQYALAGVAGSWSHVLLDSFLYGDMSLVVFGRNPFLGALGALEVYGLCAAGFLAGAALFLWRIRPLS
jgi:hypothetical protein